MVLATSATSARSFVSGIVHLRSLRFKPVIIPQACCLARWPQPDVLSGTVILFKQLDTDIPASGLKGGHRLNRCLQTGPAQSRSGV